MNQHYQQQSSEKLSILPLESFSSISRQATTKKRHWRTKINSERKETVYHENFTLPFVVSRVMPEIYKKEQFPAFWHTTHWEPTHKIIDRINIYEFLVEHSVSLSHGGRRKVYVCVFTAKKNQANHPKKNKKKVFAHHVQNSNSMCNIVVIFLLEPPPGSMGSPYYRDGFEDISPALPGHHRSRSASRPPHTNDYPSNGMELIYIQHIFLSFWISCFILTLFLMSSFSFLSLSLYFLLSPLCVTKHTYSVSCRNEISKFR